MFFNTNVLWLGNPINEKLWKKSREKIIQNIHITFVNLLKDFSSELKRTIIRSVGKKVTRTCECYKSISFQNNLLDFALGTFHWPCYLVFSKILLKQAVCSQRYLKKNILIWSHKLVLVRTKDAGKMWPF